MREIKFRAWDEEFNMMFYANPEAKNFLLLEGEKTSRRCGRHKPQGHLTYFIDGQLPVMQYTGLKDKNGTEIYEGDIVRHPQASDEFLVVKWNTFHCSFVLEFTVKNPMRLGFASLEPQWLEVIGNIYESPELLEKE